MGQSNGLITQSELARELGVDSTRLLAWRKVGVLPYKKGKKGGVRFDTAGVEVAKSIVELVNQNVPWKEIKEQLKRNATGEPAVVVLRKNAKKHAERVPAVAVSGGVPPAVEAAERRRTNVLAGFSMNLEQVVREIVRDELALAMSRAFRRK